MSRRGRTFLCSIGMLVGAAVPALAASTPPAPRPARGDVGAIHEANAWKIQSAAVRVAMNRRPHLERLMDQGTLPPAPFVVTPHTQRAVTRSILQGLPRGHTNVEVSHLGEPYWDPATKSWRQTVHAWSLVPRGIQTPHGLRRYQSWTGHVRADGSRPAILIRW
jgi:hypothetical protein